MDETHAAYFGRVVDRLEQDPRTEIYPNLPILVLKETVDILPIYLDPTEFVNHLFEFIEKEKNTLSRVIHSAQYVADNAVLASYCSAFVENIIRDTLENVDDMSPDSKGKSVYRLKWPIHPEDFPYVDEENLDKNED